MGGFRTGKRRLLSNSVVCKLTNEWRKLVGCCHNSGRTVPGHQNFASKQRHWVACGVAAYGKIRRRT